MTYRSKNKCSNGVYSNCQKHEKPQKQKLKKKSEFNF